MTIGRDTAVVHLTQGKIALIDAADWELVVPYRWHAAGNYAVTSKRKGDKIVHTFLHRLIMGLDGPDVDHINHDVLDNRQSNLPHATSNQNNANRRIRSHSSQFKGVYWYESRRGWAVGIKVDGKRRHLGLYDCEKDAGIAYDIAAREQWGTFAETNFAEVYPPPERRSTTPIRQ